MQSSIKCACKGIRTCKICNNANSNNSFENVTKYIYCEKCLLCHFIENEIDINRTCENLKETNRSICVQGIFLMQNFINEIEETFFLNEINKSKWVDSQSGRFKQDYGPKVNFKKKKLKSEIFTGLPHFSKLLIQRINSIDNVILKDFIPVELCNLKYTNERGSSIDPHFDDFWLWGDRLITVNLLTDTFLTLTPGPEISEEYKNVEVLIPLKRFSMNVLFDDARYKWMHSIKASHIKDIRVAITLRECSKEFKNGQSTHLGQYLETISLSYKGLSVGEFEDFIQNNSNSFLLIENIFSNKEINLKVDENLLEDCLRSLLEDVLHIKIETIKVNRKLFGNKFIIEINGDKIFNLKFTKKNSNDDAFIKFQNFFALNSNNNDSEFKIANIISSNEEFINGLKIDGCRYWIEECDFGEELSLADANNFYIMGKLLSYILATTKLVIIVLLMIMSKFILLVI